MLPIPEQIANELGLHSGTSVEVTRTPEGFEVKASRKGMKKGADGILRSHSERMKILEGLMGQGLHLVSTSGSQVEALVKDREADAHLDQLDETA